MVALLIPSPAWAETKKWSDEAELSYVDTGGNTEVRTLSLKNTLKYGFTELLLGTWKLGMLYGESRGATSAERYTTELRLEYKFTKRFSFFGKTEGLKDRFSGIVLRYHLGAGVGYQLLTGPTHLLITETGTNYTREKHTDDTEATYLAGRFFVRYDYLFTEKNRFFQSVEYLYDFEDSNNYNVNSETAVISALNNLLSLKAGYLVRYDNKPVPANLRKTDTTLSVALVVSF